MSLYENENENEDWLLQNDLYESAREDIAFIRNAIPTPLKSFKKVLYFRFTLSSTINIIFSLIILSPTYFLI